MRKAMFIVLGLLLFAAALGAFIYRQTLPSAEPVVSLDDRKSEDVRTRGLETGAGRPDAVTTRETGSNGESWRYLDMAINILNLIIGVIGIGMAVMGSRMQRQAMEMTSARGRSKSEM